jgi:hypothetical protein
MKNFNLLLQKQFDKMCSTGRLFRVAMTGQEVWDMYISSFEKAQNPIFRDPTSTTHNCNLCNNFIRRYGNIVAVSLNFKIVSIFDVEAGEEYASVARVLSAAITRSTIKEVFFETFQELNSLPYESCSKSNPKFQLGMTHNVKRYSKEEAEKYGVVKANEMRTFVHMNLTLPKQFVDMSGNSIEQIMGQYRDNKNVFQRAMEEISLDTLNLVRDLIIQGSLLDGQAHLYKIEAMIPKKLIYDELAKADKDNWCWVMSYNFQFSKFRNELLGVLCVELTEGEEINKACQTWNRRVDPTNYMKAIAPITKSQIRDAQKFVEENGYVESFDRRFAVLDDIKASEIKHINSGDGSVKTISMFDNVKSTSTRHKRNEFDGVEEVNIEKFMKDILPGCTSVEAFLTNQHDGHMVSLTTAKIPESKPIFKWSNNYSWTFNGNLAGKSQIKEAVKTAGGEVNGILRFSLIWNDDNVNDNSDLDAWCLEPGDVRIGYSTGHRKDRGDRPSPCSGLLDLDNTRPTGRLAIENIFYANGRQMKDGVYKFWVNQFRAENSKGFKAEIEFGGEIFVYEYNRPVSGNVPIAEVTLFNGQFSIKHSLPEVGVSSKDIYGLPTNEFHKVNLVCLSPNHWGTNDVGNTHYFFMLDKCKSPNSIRSFHAENLIPELANHRKVLEVLGMTAMIASTDKQLSGLGFNATVRDELIVRLQGTFKRVIKIKF